MNQRLLAFIVALFAVGAGFWAGEFYERHRPVPPPPDTYLTDFGGSRKPAQPVAINRAGLSREIERIKPELEAFRTRLAAIDAQFDADLRGILTPEQRVRRDEWLKKHGIDRKGKATPASEAQKPPLTDDEISQLLQSPNRILLGMVAIPMRMEQLGKELKLEDSQRDRIRELLRVRRERFLELVDQSPSPSLLLSRLAPVAQRLAGPSPTATAQVQTVSAQTGSPGAAGH